MVERAGHRFGFAAAEHKVDIGALWQCRQVGVGTDQSDGGGHIIAADPGAAQHRFETVAPADLCLKLEPGAFRRLGKRGDQTGVRQVDAAGRATDSQRRNDLRLDSFAL
jgi:hypothetical protein